MWIYVFYTFSEILAIHISVTCTHHTLLLRSQKTSLFDTLLHCQIICFITVILAAFDNDDNEDGNDDITTTTTTIITYFSIGV
jgi:hypothetical protein